MVAIINSDIATNKNMKNFKMIVILSGSFDAPSVSDNKNEKIPGPSASFFSCPFPGVDDDILFLCS